MSLSKEEILDLMRPYIQPGNILDITDFRRDHPKECQRLYVFFPSVNDAVASLGCTKPDQKQVLLDLLRQHATPDGTLDTGAFRREHRRQYQLLYHYFGSPDKAIELLGCKKADRYHALSSLLREYIKPDNRFDVCAFKKDYPKESHRLGGYIHLIVELLGCTEIPKKESGCYEQARP